ncbi:MAG: CoB--CoM heterodisulfide reductase subunit C [Candidatus Lokiarchaeota archaeon]|nr:CoB--CoM heterodisulfide reductase subunit C [Candidatus Lokiarchaeota archaeon]MBD3201513.1 CoB--CoM heterodisulfide reductase subunit C [Candidatus Lokiarchaeota archaeon]
MSKTKEHESKEFKTDNDFDPDFFKDIERKSNIWSCIQCGTCTASCESGRWTALKTRTIIRKLTLGDLTVLKDPDIWLCTTCYQCYERCPRDVKPTDVIMELRNYATKLGNISPNHRAVVGYLKNYGHAVPINDEVKQQRKELGLEELPPTLFKFKSEGDTEDIEKIKELLFDLPEEKEKEEEK